MRISLSLDDSLSVHGIPLRLDNSGPSLAERWKANFDLKRATIRSDVSVAGGSTLTAARLDPWLYSVGVRLRF